MRPRVELSGTPHKKFLDSIVCCRITQFAVFFLYLILVKPAKFSVAFFIKVCVELCHGFFGEICYF